MTSEWKSTINNAYTNPRQLHPVLEQTIPSLIKDEVQRLANLVLFQNNVRSSGISSQVPVDMKFTGDALNIRISKKAPWISLLPSSKLNMSPEEKAVDAVRREVMEKIALLWGGVSSDSSIESDSSDRSTSGSFGESRRTTQRTRSKRNRRNERQRRTGRTHTPSTRISRNKIDCSTHTTNNYYCCVGAHSSLSPHSSEQKSKHPTADSHTQTEFSFNPVFKHQKLPGNHRVTDFSEDSSSNESEDSSTHSFSSKQQRKNRHSDTSELEDSSSDESKDRSADSVKKKRQLKNRHSNRMNRRNSFNNESENNSTRSGSRKSSLKESFSRDHDIETSVDLFNEVCEISEDNSTGSFDRRTSIREANEANKKSEPISTRYFTDKPDMSSDSDISDAETELRYFTANEKTPSDEDSDIENISFSRKLGDLLRNNTEPMPSLRPIPSKAADPFIEIKKFIEAYDTDAKPLGHRRAFIELQAELAQEKPDRAKINNLLSLLQADSLQIMKEVPKDRIVKESNTASTTTSQESTTPQTTRIIQVNPMTVDQDTQTDPQIVSTKDQHTNTQSLANEEQDSLQLMNNGKELVSPEEITELNTFVTDSIEQINVYMDIVNNDMIEVEIDPETQSFLLHNRGVLLNLQNLINFDSPFEKTNNTINSLLEELDLNTLRLVSDNPDLEIPFIEEDFDDASTLVGSIIHQLSPRQVTRSTQKDFHQADEEIELLEKLQDLLEKVESLDNNISLSIEKSPTANAATQSDEYRTDKEIKLQKRLQTLSRKYENLAGDILKQSKKEQKQQADINELRFQLQHTKNELVEALRRFETLAESTEKNFKMSEDQSEYIRNLERELEELQQLLISIPNTKNPKLVSKVIATQTESQEDDSIEEIEETKTTLPFNIAQEKEDTEAPFSLVQSSVKTPSPIPSENEEEEIGELLDQYQELGKDLQTVKKEDDLPTLEEFYNKYANSGIHTQLHVLAEYLRFDQDPLNPSRDMVLKRRQDTLDMLRLFDKTLSEETWSDDSGNETDESAVLLEPTLFELNNIDSKNREENTSVSTNTAVVDAATQYEKITTTDPLIQDGKHTMTDMSTQVTPTSFANASTQAVRATTESSTQVNHKSDKELELESQLGDTSTKFEKLAAFVETEFKSTEDQLESMRKLETQVQALEEVNQDLIATINVLKKRKILPTEREEITETQFTEEKEAEADGTENKEIGIDPSVQVEPSHYVFADLPPHIRRSFHLYETVTHDLNELNYSLSTKKFYEKYKKSTVTADLSTFAKRVDQIDPITDITLPTEQEIDNVVQQVTQIFLQEKELEEAELAELEKDFDQRLKKYNELTSDLQKFHNEQLTLAELYNKYANTNAIRELEIFARQERDQPPSRDSVEKKIKNLRELLITFDNDLNRIDF